MNDKKFYFGVLIIVIITSAVITGLKFSPYNNFINPYIWLIQGFMLVVTVGAYYVSNKGIRDNLMDFQNYVMASIGIRFFLSAIIIFGYIYLKKEGSASFLGNFFILYLLYTGFEIKSVLSNLRAHLNNDKK